MLHIKEKEKAYLSFHYSVRQTKWAFNLLKEQFFQTHRKWQNQWKAGCQRGSKESFCCGFVPNNMQFFVRELSFPLFLENVVQTTGNEKIFIKPPPTSTRSFQGRYKSPYSLREEEKGNTFLSPGQSTKTMREESFLSYSWCSEIMQWSQNWVLELSCQDCQDI